MNMVLPDPGGVRHYVAYYVVPYVVCYVARIEGAGPPTPINVGGSNA
jgi:hypothetical protein